MSRKSIACLLACLFSLGLANSFAEVPALIHYQGRVLDDGCPLNGTNSLVLRLYDAPSAGNLLYADSNNVVLVDGVYSTMLGDDTVFGSLTNAVTNAAVYLEVDINGTVLSPRERLVSVPYALMTGGVLPGSITPGMLNKQYQSGCFTVDVSAVNWSTNIHISFPNTFKTTPIVTFSYDSQSTLTPQIVPINKTTGGYNARVSILDWKSVPMDQEDPGGLQASACLVNGRPAAAYAAATTYQSLKYVRALDADGFTWASPITIEATNQAEVGSSASMCIINGNPAIAYCGVYSSTTNRAVRFVRAMDPNGDSWGAPVTVVTSAPIPGIFALSMCEVNGAPAIAYCLDSPAYDLKYVRASDANGTSWPSGITVDTTATEGVGSPLITIVNGNPAIAYDHDTGRTVKKYIRASNNIGSSWGASITVSTNSGGAPTLAIINGRPAMAFANYFVRASDANGDSWPVAGISHPPWDSAAGDPHLNVIGGLPVMVYDEGFIHYIQSADVNGSAWASPCQVLGFPGLVLAHIQPMVQLSDSTLGILVKNSSRLEFLRLGARFVVEWVAVEP